MKEILGLISADLLMTGVKLLIEMINPSVSLRAAQDKFMARSSYRLSSPDFKYWTFNTS